MPSPADGAPRAPRTHTALAALAILVVTGVGYWNLKDNRFIGFDDNDYIVENQALQRGLSLETVAWAFATDKKTTYWHPLTWLSLALDHQLFGLDPTGYHLVNLLLHTLTALLLFFMLRSLSGRLWPSALAALLFAAHPMNVEAVAWAVERKSTLSALLWVGTVWAYAGWAVRRRLWRYLLALALMALGLLAKPVLVTLPFVLLLVDHWPLGRLRLGSEAAGGAPSVGLGRAVLEKLPFLALSLSSVLLTMASVRHAGSAAISDGSTLLDRVLGVPVSYCLHLLKLVVPTKLAVFYPPVSARPAWQAALAALVLLGITAVAVRWARRRPWLIVGWLWFAASFFPTSGIVRSGLFPELANRFVYVPAIGLFIALSWWWTGLARGWRHRRIVILAGAAALLVPLTVASHLHTRRWFDRVTLFGYAVAATENNGIAYYNLGEGYLERGDRKRAAAVLEQAREALPTSPGPDIKLAEFALRERDGRAALVYGERALSRAPDHIYALWLLGSAHRLVGELEAAAVAFGKAATSPEPDIMLKQDLARRERDKLLRLLAPRLEPLRQRVASDPGSMAARFALAMQLHRVGLYREALEHYGAIERAGERRWQLYFNIAATHGQLRQHRTAARYYEKSLRLNPRDPRTCNNLGVEHSRRGDQDKAIAVFKDCIARVPHNARAHFNLARAYYRRGDRDEAARRFGVVWERFPQLRPTVREYLTALGRAR